MKNLLMSLVLALGSLTAYADIVITTDESTTVKIADIASITFDGDFNTGNLVINYSDGSQAKTPIASIKNISFQPETSAVESTLTDSNLTTVSVSGNLLFITSNGGKASLYDVQGKLTQNITLQNGVTTLSLDNLPNATYIIKAGGKTIKFLKK